MAQTVSNIITQAKTIISTTLGASWKELRNVYAVDENDLRVARKGYGIVPRGASPAETVVGNYTLDHTFEVVLVQTNPRKADESDAVEAIADLFNQHDEIYKQFVQTKLNLSGTVILVGAPSLSEPEFINDKAVVVVRQSIPVRYRQSIR